jgi:hypothetical protein
MPHSLARIFSYLLHPFLMPSYALLLIFGSDTYIGFGVTLKAQQLIFLVVFVNTFLIPTILSFFLVRKKLVSDIEMPSNLERRLPLLITTLFYIFTYYLLLKVRLSPIVYVVMMAATLSIVIAMMVNLKWKISLHMLGIGGLIGALIGISLRQYVDFRGLIILLILLAGILGSSRLKLDAHTPAQVYVGFMVGVSCELILLLGL